MHTEWEEFYKTATSHTACTITNGNDGGKHPFGIDRRQVRASKTSRVINNFCVHSRSGRKGEERLSSVLSVLDLLQICPTVLTHEANLDIYTWTSGGQQHCLRGWKEQIPQVSLCISLTFLLSDWCFFKHSFRTCRAIEQVKVQLSPFLSTSRCPPLSLLSA